MSDKIKVLVVEPMQPCRVQEISTGLESMQAIVGGYIEEVTPFTDPVAIVCNEQGKMQGLPFNRPLVDRHGLPYDVLCGTFFIAGVEGEHFISLTEEQIQKYKNLYDNMAVLTAERPAQAEIISDNAMPDFAVSCQISFQLIDQERPGAQDAFISHVTGVFNQDQTLAERTVDDLHFTFRGRCAEVWYTFAAQDRDAASAEAFSEQCVLNVRDRLEGYGCKVEKVECFAEELDPVPDQAGDRGSPRKKKEENHHER